MLRISSTAGALLLLVLLVSCGGYDDERDYGPTGPTYPDPPPSSESSDDENPWDY
jgi:hypothetical protein